MVKNISPVLAQFSVRAREVTQPQDTHLVGDMICRHGTSRPVIEEIIVLGPSENSESLITETTDPIDPDLIRQGYEVAPSGQVTRSEPGHGNPDLVGRNLSAAFETTVTRIQPSEHDDPDLLRCHSRQEMLETVLTYAGGEDADPDLIRLSKLFEEYCDTILTATRGEPIDPDLVRTDAYSEEALSPPKAGAIRS